MKAVDIEHLVRWAYRDELPKVGRETSLIAAIRSSWSSLSRYGQLLTVVQEGDIANRWGLVPLAGADDPHPDALAVADAVEALAEFEVELPEGWNPLSDMGDLGPEGMEAVQHGLDRLSPVGADGRRALRQPLARVLIRSAVLGSAPSWEAETPARRIVTGANGKPMWFRRIVATSPGPFGPVTTMVEVDGYNPSRQRPFPNAYQKVELVPDPASVVVERGEYELWVAGLGLLVDLLAEKLVAHVALPCQRAPRPWEAAPAEVVADTRILPSLLVSAHQRRGRSRKGPISA